MPILNKVVPTSVKTKLWDLTGISNQDVWKGANKVFSDKVAVRMPIRNLLHLSTIKIHWTTFPPRISIHSGRRHCTQQTSNFAPSDSTTSMMTICFI
ncbi:hypothetical protein B9Z55_000280 [Caenorhabditis nigoni]|uniref:DUF38 domain-containing protein n=1 Tax=Caenorhabditis nigoni TaxID=1611254 RepID=A0A2G5VMG6_9PELO|nr:hypothetical protein B9Z55_000280 [Caenorhabditis nigoni]